eukprot:TRINITY_DN50621_c0_g1_i1.p1 TRINITY_DN50621_c0_g1~~TRINITY_DN50621_c0_g1_i1.p1  ORF type:complete len:324 (+),score=57.98 TRINITY_DN50621_c0_g1_i1:129-1100(+)
MGLGEDAFVNPGAISETLKCPVCFDIFEDPVFCGGNPCQHVFCRTCVEQAILAPSTSADGSTSRRGGSGHDGIGSEDEEIAFQESLGEGNCPTCRAVIRVHLLQPHQAIRSMLDELPVKCRRACGWTGRRDALPAHESEGSEQCPLLRLEAAAAEVAFLSEAGQHLRDRDRRIAELELRVAEQDHQVVDVGRQLLAREVRIQELESRLEEQERQLAQKDMELALVRRSGLGMPPGMSSGGSGVLLSRMASAPPSPAPVSPSGGSGGSMLLRSADSPSAATRAAAYSPTSAEEARLQRRPRPDPISPAQSAAEEASSGGADLWL